MHLSSLLNSVIFGLSLFDICKHTRILVAGVVGGGAPAIQGDRLRGVLLHDGGGGNNSKYWPLIGPHSHNTEL